MSESGIKELRKKCWKSDCGYMYLGMFGFWHILIRIPVGRGDLGIQVITSRAFDIPVKTEVDNILSSTVRLHLYPDNRRKQLIASLFRILEEQNFFQIKL